MSGLDSAGKGLRADARDNRVRILAAASERFALDGLAAEMDAIARDAGVAVGTLYRHFETKDALLDAVLREGFQRMAQFARSLMEEPDTWLAVERLVRHIAERQVSNQAFKDVLVANPGLRATALTLKRELGPLIQRIVSRAQEAGQLREEVTAGDLPMLLTGLPIGKKDGQTRERYLAIVLSGLRKPS